MKTPRTRPTVTRNFDLSTLCAGRAFRHGLRTYVLPIGCNAAWPGWFHLSTIRAAHLIPVWVYALTLRFEALANRLYTWLVRLTRPLNP